MEAVPAVLAAEKAAAAFSPAETAKLVVLWAQNQKADFAQLADKLGQDLGRVIEAKTVHQELLRLSLIATSGNRAMAAKTH